MLQGNRKYKTVLTIAGFDGGGGAGIQADLKTFAALECYGLSVLTALPVQNTCGVRAIYSIGRQCVNDQLCSIFEDFEVNAIKIGMLHNTEIIDCVSTSLQSYAHLPIVLDPVMVATSGDALISDDALHSMIESLFPLVTLLTPNIPEASKVLGSDIKIQEEIEAAASTLAQLGPKAVLIKGGHFINTSCDDCLYVNRKLHWFSSQRVSTKNLHGTGCTLSSAITAFLARGYGILEATRLAKQYLSQAIEAGASFHLGHGYGPVHHFFAHWETKANEPFL